MKDSWNKYIDLFLNYLKAERNASPHTILNYSRDLRAFVDFSLENGVRTPKKVEKLLVRSFLNYLNKRDLSHSSIARNMSALRSFFRYLLREGLANKNPAAIIASPKLDKRLPAFLTVDEAKHLIESPELSKPYGQRDRAILELLYASGLRISEVVNMDIEQVNLDTNEIRVWGKGAKERVVLIGSPAAHALSAYMSEGRPHLLGNKRSSALFLTTYEDEAGIHSGERLTVRRAQKILNKYAKIIDKKVHPHKLRHTFATHLLDGGADLRVVQELLGHAQLTSTQKYTHVTQSRARKVYLSAHPMAKKKNDDSE